MVIDTCYGASSSLLEGLGTLDATVVAAPSLVPVRGLSYGPAFFTVDEPAIRAAAVDLPRGTLTRWRIDQAALTARLAAIDVMSPDALRAALVRRTPPEVRLPLGDGGDILVPIEWSRVADARPGRRPRSRSRGRRPRRGNP